MSRGRKPKTQFSFDENESNPALYLSSKPPASLVGTVAKARWKSTIETLGDENRRLPRSNEGIMIGFCSAFQLLADCEAALEEHGMFISGGRDGLKRSPALAGKIQALTAIRSYASEIGISPSSAGRLPLPPIEPEFNPFTNL